jgi:putative Holliday junction resolvase
MDSPDAGRILALDFGTRRIGAALSDPERRMAFPLEQYDRRTPQRDAAHYRELVREERVSRIVIGLPLHTRGAESELSAQARAFGQWLGEITATPVVFFDERYTSVLADELLSHRKLSRAQRAARRDAMAALVLLQAYLDAGCPEVEAAPAPLEDPNEDAIP